VKKFSVFSGEIGNRHIFSCPSNEKKIDLSEKYIEKIFRKKRAEMVEK